MEWPEGIEEAAGTRKLLAEGALPVAGPQDVPDIRLALADHIRRLERQRLVEDAQKTLFG